MDIFAEIEIAEPQTGQKIAVPAPQIIGGDSDPVRQKFYDMRGMASDNPYTWSGARLFYKQAKFMENFEDDYGGEMEFSMHCPCYQRMGYERLRTYFTRRMAARRGEFSDTSLSYVFLYVYELLSCVGADSPLQALENLLALRQAYAEKFPVLDEYLPAWLKDFHVYYELPHSFAQFVCDNNMHEFYADLFMFDGNADILAWNKISAYDVTKSKFYTATAENATILNDSFQAAIGGLTALCEKKAIRLKDLFTHAGGDEIHWLPFRRALFHPWLRQENRTVELPGGEIFKCKDNNWTTFHTAAYAHKKDLAAFIIKKTEAQTRAATAFKTKITADPSTLLKASAALTEIGITTREIENAIEKSITEFFAEKNRIVINVDRKNLDRIRVEADDITEKLVVEEDGKEKTVGALPPPPPQGDAVPLTPKIGDGWAELSSQLGETEKEALKMIFAENVDMGKIKTFADSKGLMLEILVDNINEKAMEAVGDNILELADELTVYDEYKNELMAICVATPHR